MSSVGVLALQGASAPHVASFARLGVTAREVRAPRELDGLTHIVLPGGESTTLHHLLVLFGLWDALRARHREGSLALFGTCAGAILLARDAGGLPPTLGLLDAVVERNAYGRQADSFVGPIELEEELESAELGPARLYHAAFIRAPRFTSVGPGVRVLALRAGEPVAIEAPGLLATTFHPELGEDLRFHARFLDACPGAAKASHRSVPEASARR